MLSTRTAALLSLLLPASVSARSLRGQKQHPELLATPLSVPTTPPNDTKQHLSVLNSSSAYYDEGKTKKYLNLAQASYCVDSTKWTCATCDSGVAVTQVIEARGGRAVVGYNQDAGWLFVAFRGSSNIQNWIDNIDAVFKKPYADLPDVKVDAGFYREYSYLADAGIPAALAAAKAASGLSDVIVTGHSAGGACATLLAFDIGRGDGEYSSMGLHVASVTTFGSPRVGNWDFVQAHAALGLPSARVTHWYDIVPHVPEELLGYHHVISEVWYNEANSDYTECSDSAFSEDDECSNSCSPISCTSVDNHLDYIGVVMGSDNC